MFRPNQSSNSSNTTEMSRSVTFFKREQMSLLQNTTSRQLTNLGLILNFKHGKKKDYYLHSTFREHNGFRNTVFSHPAQFQMCTLSFKQCFYIYCVWTINMKHACTGACSIKVSHAAQFTSSYENALLCVRVSCFEADEP